MDFSDTADHTLDAKGRLTIPSRYRAAFSDGLWVGKSFDPCLWIWPTEDYNEMVERAMAHVTYMAPRWRQLQHHFRSKARETELDAAGRVLLPPSLLRAADLNGEVKVTGEGPYLAVWDPPALAAYDVRMDTESPDITESFDEHPS